MRVPSCRAPGCCFEGVQPLALPQSMRQLTLSQGYSNITPAYLQAREPLLAPRKPLNSFPWSNGNTQMTCTYRCHGAVAGIVSGATSHDAHDMQAFPLLSIAFVEVKWMPITRSEVGAASNSHLMLLLRQGQIIRFHHQASNAQCLRLLIAPPLQYK